MTVTDKQVMMMQKVMSEEGRLGVAALKSGMSRQTAAKYYREGKLPSELTKPRAWQTRSNPFEEVWTEVVSLLEESPGLEAKSIFEELDERYPDRFNPGQVRTLQRHIRRWRALHGDDKSHELFFPQRHRPGEAAQTDFTFTGELNLTIDGQPYKPWLCHVVLPYSGWEWATACRSESFLALRQGIQEAFYRLGCTPCWHQTDNSTSATHNIRSGGRAFSKDYEELMQHLGMKPRVIAIGKKEQNGTVEAKNGAFKRLLKQQLLRRGSADFESEKAFETFLQTCLQKANAKRKDRLKEELQVMTPLTAKRMLEFSEQTLRVSRNATINVKGNIYSMPPRFKGHQVKARVFENHLEIFYGNEKIQEMPRLIGSSQHCIDYRHVIWSLIRKPGAFERFVYRDDLYPSEAFREAYHSLKEVQPGTAGDLSYLRILHLAASTMESEVECALKLILAEKKVPYPDLVKSLVVTEDSSHPKLDEPIVNLNEYNDLLVEVAS